MKLILGLAVALLLVACGTEEDAVRTPPPPAPGQLPAGEPPRPPGTGPPPAWVSTESGAHWLGYSTFCWGTTCADYVAPSCDAPHVPTLELRRGDTIDLILDFDAESLSLSFVDGEGPELKLDAEQPRWTAADDGAFTVFARAKAGDASYVGCIRFTD